ncbi:uncharacterized protein LMH87_007622 [Akanthomyces muscarius]|uniref:Uncharacterized protein n=1 Tax=Akanthomyces muscarius TaxID=2231603 RepID=A0A9W8UR95_AKAMU|nr:uncharacterized protein LMH87_007622 [Akanthomyces muscarius]KAJ4161591.1 hypothetical protein LMH87_007622 [Akanthomyces muscarius]
MSSHAREESHSAKICRGDAPRKPKARLDRALMHKEFLNHELKDDNSRSSCPLEALELPRLRRCAFDVSTLHIIGPVNPIQTRFEERVDGGLDGYNWQIRFGERGPFVLKVFWDQEPPTPPLYYALQRECQAAAVLQLMQEALAQDDPSLDPVLVYPEPCDWREGYENMLAFSDEWRRKGSPCSASTPMTEITSMPRIRKCYGWIKIAGDILYQLPPLWQPPHLKIEKIPRQIERNKEYTALVYEYVEEGENNAEVIQESLNFFRDAGFSHTRISLARNWKKRVYLSVNFIPGLDIPSIKMPTILEALAEKSVAKDFNCILGVAGSNTACDTTISIEQWHSWEDFTYNNIKQIFKKDLGRRYKGENEPSPLPMDLDVFKEDATQDALGRFPVPIVNYALDSSGGSEHFGRGSRCETNDMYVPDWSVLSKPHAIEAGMMLNMLPGDTKISSKWRSSMLEDNDGKFDEWKKVLDQVVTYMAWWSARYGFIVTDTEVVALRIHRQHVPDGLAVHRPRRSRRSDATITLSSDPVSIASSEGFQDTDPLLWDFGVEYKAIPWSAHGSGKLTGKLALWALARMASCGDRSIEYSYPGLDTWRTQDTGRGIVHNTSGAKLDNPTKHTEIQQRDHFVHAAPGAGSNTKDLSSDDEDASRSEAYESEAVEEPELPQFSRPASAGLEHTAAVPDAQPAEDRNAWILVKVERRGREYYYKDYKEHRKSSSKSDWEAVDGGYVLRGKRHVYFTKKLP